MLFRPQKKETIKNLRKTFLVRRIE